MEEEINSIDLYDASLNEVNQETLSATITNSGRKESTDNGG